MLWLSPLGGWTKEDDVPLDVRIHQHEEVLNSGTTHPGGLDPATTVMAIWPSPMVYAGPTEVQFHAKSRRSAGASYFVVGRDPKMLSFVKVMYDTADNVMKVPDDSRLDDFISISGTKMRLLARNGAHLCSPDNIPTDLVSVNCIPSGFMVPKGWDGVVDYYKNVEDKERWVPWSKPRVDPPNAVGTEFEGVFGSVSFKLKHASYTSWWHSVPLRPESGAGANDEQIINFITEIPMYVTAKMEVNKEEPGNVIMQDVNKDGSARHYTYGVPFFNYGLIPQTWEDPELLSPMGFGGDNDPLDVMEIGSTPLEMEEVMLREESKHWEYWDVLKKYILVLPYN